MSEPTTPNEREAFEAYYTKFGRGTRPGRFVQYIDPDDETVSHYVDPFVSEAWHIWQAAWKAALSRTDPAVASTAAVPEGAEAVAWESGGTVYAVNAESIATSIAEDLIANPAENWHPLFAHPPRESGDAERWMPIETAPKDGTKIQVFCPRLGVCGPAEWNSDRFAKRPRPYWDHWGSRIWGINWVRDDQPTHWMPMEPAPDAARTAEGGKHG